MLGMLRDIPTVERLSRESGGRSSGFDYLRFGLASSIILIHTVIVSYGLEYAVAFQRAPYGMVFSMVLPMFFALSGYLVAGSLDRTPGLISFFSLRVLRIVPALGVEITLSALIFGPILTAFTLREYFSDPILWRYFFNIIGYVHFYLPGLFLENPSKYFVNAQLWTVPFELESYVVLGGLAVGAVIRRPWVVLVLACIGQALWIKYGLTHAEDLTRGPIASGSDLVISFLFGVTFHLFRRHVPMHWSLFILACLVSAAILSIPNGGFMVPLPAAYITVYLGLLNPRRAAFLAGGDYSYGLFLYGYPIQQVVASLGEWTHHWWINLAIAYPAALGIAMVSWHFIEKPALGLRRHLPRLEAWAARMPTIRAAAAQRLIDLRAAPLLRLASFLAGAASVVVTIDQHELLGLAGIGAAILCAYLASGLEKVETSRFSVTGRGKENEPLPQP